MRRVLNISFWLCALAFWSKRVQGALPRSDPGRVAHHYRNGTMPVLGNCASYKIFEPVDPSPAGSLVFKYGYVVNAKDRFSLASEASAFATGIWMWITAANEKRIMVGNRLVRFEAHCYFVDYDKFKANATGDMPETVQKLVLKLDHSLVTDIKIAAVWLRSSFGGAVDSWARQAQLADFDVMCMMYNGDAENMNPLTNEKLTTAWDMSTSNALWGDVFLKSVKLKLRQHPEMNKVAVLTRGDTGWYGWMGKQAVRAVADAGMELTTWEVIPENTSQAGPPKGGVGWKDQNSVYQMRDSVRRVKAGGAEIIVYCGSYEQMSWFKAVEDTKTDFSAIYAIWPGGNPDFARSIPKATKYTFFRAVLIERLDVKDSLFGSVKTYREDLAREFAYDNPRGGDGYSSAAGTVITSAIQELQTIDAKVMNRKLPSMTILESIVGTIKFGSNAYNTGDVVQLTQFFDRAISDTVVPQKLATKPIFLPVPTWDCRVNDTLLGALGTRRCECPTGHEAAPSGASCQTCAAGDFSPGGQKPCGPCTQGTFSAAGSKNCTLCFPGKFASGVKSSGCSMCAVGRYSSEQGATDCQFCPRGKYVGVGSRHCVSCPQGRSTRDSPASNKTDCVCAKGYFEKNGVCVICPEGSSTKEVGQTAIEACLCEKGTYMPLSKRACMECPKGMACLAGSSEANYPKNGAGFNTTFKARSEEQQVPRLLKGFWSSLDGYGPMSVFMCDSDKRCLGGDPDSVCAEDLKGLNCAHCADAMIWNGEKCEPCTSLQASKVLWPAIFCMVLPTIFVAMYKFSGEPAEKWSAWKNARPTFIFIVLNFVQTIGLMNAVSLAAGVSESKPPVISMLSDSNVFVDPANMLAIACAGFGDFKSLMAVKSAVPLFVILVFFLTQLGSIMAGKLNPSLAMDFDRHLSCLGALMFTVFSSIAAMCLLLFKCKQNPNGMAVMVEDMSVVCHDTDNWKSMLILAVVCIIVYLFGLSCLFLYGIMKASKGAFVNAAFQKRWKFLFIKFHPRVFWWGLAHLLKNILINVAFSVLSTNFSSLTLTMGITIMFTFGVVVFMPYRHHFANYFEIAVQFMIMMIVCVLRGYTDSSQDVNANSNVGILAAVCAGLALAATFCLTFFARERGISESDVALMQEQYTCLAVFEKAGCLDLLKSMPSGEREELLDAITVLHSELGVGSTQKWRLVTERTIRNRTMYRSSCQSLQSGTPGTAAAPVAAAPVAAAPVAAPGKPTMEDFCVQADMPSDVKLEYYVPELKQIGIANVDLKGEDKCLHTWEEEVTTV